MSDCICEPGKWSYACQCLRCRWEQWWNEEDADEPAVQMPDEPYPGPVSAGFRSTHTEREER